MTDFTIRSIMRQDYPTLAPDMPIQKAVTLLVENDAPAAPVTDNDGSLIGVLTQKDCFRPVLQAAYFQDWRGLVSDHMSEEVITIDPEHDVVHAAELFLTHPHRQFPVREGVKLVGMLYRSDVLSRLSGIEKQVR